MISYNNKNSLLILLYPKKTDKLKVEGGFLLVVQAYSISVLEYAFYLQNNSNSSELILNFVAFIKSYTFDQLIV